MVVLSNGILPDPEAVRKLMMEYNMTPQSVHRDVAHIRQWMQKQPHLPRIPPSKNDEINNWIEGFLRLTKNSVEKSKIAIDSYFKSKNLLPDLYSCIANDFHSYVHSDIFNNFYMMLLPKLTYEGAKIMLYGPTTDDASLFQPNDFFRRMALVLDIQQKAGIDFTGLRVIIYLRHATLAHLAQFDLPLLKRVFKLAKKAYPIRIRNTHIIFPPGFVEAAVKIMKPFLSKKVMSRITIHKDLESLWDIVPKENLPSDLGGDLPSMQEFHEIWRNHLLEHYEWFMETKDLVADESKRLVNKEKKAAKFGKNGSFRQLSLD